MLELSAQICSFLSLCIYRKYSQIDLTLEASVVKDIFGIEVPLYFHKLSRSLPNKNLVDVVATKDHAMAISYPELHITNKVLHAKQTCQQTAI